jgi:hypothetical protein
MSTATLAELLARTAEGNIAPDWQPVPYQIDWGHSKPRARRHSLARSAMHDGPQGVRHYRRLPDAMSDDERLEVAPFEPCQRDRYLRARSIGLSHVAAWALVLHAAGELDAADAERLLAEHSQEASHKKVDSVASGVKVSDMSNATATVAANDTTPVAFINTMGAIESATWRARRMATLIRITDVRNAGKRGKMCAVFEVRGGNLDFAAPVIHEAVLAGASVHAMAATLADVSLCGLTFEAHEQKAITVPVGEAIEVQADLVRATFTSTEMLASFTALHSHKGGTIRQDTLVGCDKRADAAKAYAWAKSNASRMATMTLSDFRAEMSAIGCQIS